MPKIPPVSNPLLTVSTEVGPASEPKSYLVLPTCWLLKPMSPRRYHPPPTSSTTAGALWMIGGRSAALAAGTETRWNGFAEQGQHGTSVIVLELSDVMLRIELEAELGDEVELGLQEIDVVFLVRHQLLEEIPGDIVLRGMAVGSSLLVERAGGY